MAEYDDYEDNYEGDSENLVKDLRKQLKQLSKEKSELSQELTALKTESRSRTLSETLQAKGINPKVAKFIPTDLESDEDISNWLNENAELFGAAVDTVETEANTPSSEERSAADRLRTLSENASTPSKVDDIAAKLANATSDDEINAIWADARNYFL